MVDQAIAKKEQLLGLGTRETRGQSHQNKTQPNAAK
jgi:hypothetical protein